MSKALDATKEWLEYLDTLPKGFSLSDLDSFKEGLADVELNGNAFIVSGSAAKQFKKLGFATINRGNHYAIVDDKAVKLCKCPNCGRRNVTWGWGIYTPETFTILCQRCDNETAEHETYLLACKDWNRNAADSTN